MLASRLRIAAFLVMALAAAAQVRAQPAPPTVTLDDALAQAFERSPGLAAARAAVAEAEGRLTSARTYPYNPEVGVEGAARIGPAETTPDYSIELSQEIELLGQTSRRQMVAEAEVEKAGAELQAARAALAGAVRLAFVEAIAAREILAVEEAHAVLTRDLVALAERRMQAGAGTQLDLNMASIEAGRAEAQVETARAAATLARAVLAQTMSVVAQVPPDAEGTLDLPEERVPTPEALLGLARQHRAEFLAVRAEVDAARARIELAAREGTPNLGIGLFYGREANSETLVGARLSAQIPIFNRNQGGRAEAQATGRRVEAEAAALALRIDQEVLGAATRLRATVATAKALRDHVLGTFEENLRLLQQAVEAGKIAGAEILVVRRELRDGRRELVQALADAWRARVELDAATGEILPKNSESTEGTR